MRKLLIVALLLAGCTGSGAQPPETPHPTIFNSPTDATVDVTEPPVDFSTPVPHLPGSYASLSSRAWAKLVKSPDSYLGNGYKVWACITQFDAATGLDSFRGQASFRKESLYNWYSNASNAFFSGDATQLADFVSDDVVSMSVMSLGSFSYDTQNGGNTTVPLFQVVKIARVGSCKL
jgi:hypothetical protein